MIKRIDCIILAGGKGKRIGSFKPLLMLNQKPLIFYPFSIAKKFFSNVIIVVKNREQKMKIEKALGKKVKVVEDKSRKFSPIVGIKAGIEFAKSEKIFLLACDMPFVDEKTISKILKEEADCVAFKWKDGRIEPFCAVYDKKIFERARDDESLRSLIKKVKNKKLIEIKNPLAFFNINKKEDLKKSKQFFRDFKF
ncbi:MAG: molybdenum cofactor guanylyltransferase [Candidatus Aenigmatarchaeota archaeon]